MVGIPVSAIALFARVRCMRISAGIQTIIDQAAKEKRCFYGSTHSQRRAMLNLARDGELKRTYCNTYMTAHQWDGLVPPGRMLYTARSLGERHERRVFAGHIAVAAHKLDHPWRIHDNTVVIAASCSPTVRPSSRLRRIYAPRVISCTKSGIAVTTIERTLIDCALTYSLQDVLSMFDSALRLELTIKDAILQECDSLRRDAGRVLRALHYDYADARSENGGEFECRAVIIEAGFMVPELQVEFNIDGRIKRVDFVHQMAPVPPTCGRHTAGGVGSEA